MLCCMEANLSHVSAKVCFECCGIVVLSATSRVPAVSHSLHTEAPQGAGIPWSGVWSKGSEWGGGGGGRKHEEMSACLPGKVVQSWQRTVARQCTMRNIKCCMRESSSSNCHVVLRDWIITKHPAFQVCISIGCLAPSAWAECDHIHCHVQAELPRPLYVWSHKGAVSPTPLPHPPLFISQTIEQLAARYDACQAACVMHCFGPLLCGVWCSHHNQHGASTFDPAGNQPMSLSFYASTGQSNRDNLGLVGRSLIFLKSDFFSELPVLSVIIFLNLEFVTISLTKE